MIQKMKNRKGFTLIEMLVVIAIIAVLVAIIVPTVTSSTTKAAAATDAANLRSAKAEITIAVLEDSDLKGTSSATEGATYPGASGTAPEGKSSDAGDFAWVIDNEGNVTVNFGEGKTIEHYAGIAAGE